MFEIAYQTGRPLQEIRELPYEDFLKWFAFFEARPVGWRDDDRTFKLLQAQGVKEKPERIFPSLRPIYSPVVETNSQGTNMSSLKNSAIFTKMLGAVGGDSLKL